MMKIKAVDPQSPFYGYVRKGFTVKAVNGQPIVDSIDFRFKTAEEQLRVVFVDNKGGEIVFHIENDYPGDLGLTFDDGRVMVCDNNCIFCFVHQQPKGMRRALYVKDEDYRLSFTHGNFVTLTNVTDEQIERYRDEVRERWGEQALQESEERTKKMGKEKTAELQAEGGKIFRTISDNMHRGYESDVIQKQVAKHTS